MADNRKNPEIDIYIAEIEKWQEETERLRTICLDCGLTEEMKWRKPCYTFQNNNIVIIQGFKEYCALLFFKGVLLKDANSILKKTGEYTHVGRQIRFVDAKEIIKLEPVLKSYIYEAIEIEKKDIKITPANVEDFSIPKEFQHKLDEDLKLKTAFNALTAGRRKAYIFYFSVPKQSKTRELRIEKYILQILNGKGLND